MSKHSEAYNRTKEFVDFCELRNESSKRFFVLSKPWIYEKILAYLRGDENFERVTLDKKHLLQNGFLFFGLRLLSRLRLFQDGNTDLLLVVSSENHLLPLYSLEEGFIKSGKSYSYVTNKAKIYKSLRNRKQRVYFIDSNSYNRLENILVARTNSENEFYSSLEKCVISNIRFFQHLERQWDILIDRLNPKILISGNELILSHRVGMFAMRNRNLKTLVFQHGQINSENYIYNEMVCDKFLVFGEISKKEAIKIGLSENRISVIGKLKLTNRNINQSANSVFIDSKKENVLVAFSGFGNSTSLNHHKGQIKVVDFLASYFKEINFIVKLHPKDDAKYYNDLKSGNVNVITHFNFESQGGNLIELIANCRVLITSLSAIMYDAFELGVPVCILDLDREYEKVDIIKSNAITYCESKEVLKCAVKEIILSAGTYRTIGSAKEYLSSFYFKEKQRDVSDLFLNEILTS